MQHNTTVKIKIRRMCLTKRSNLPFFFTSKNVTDKTHPYTRIEKHVLCYSRISCIYLFSFFCDSQFYLKRNQLLRREEFLINYRLELIIHTPLLVMVDDYGKYNMRQRELKFNPREVFAIIDT